MRFMRLCPGDGTGGKTHHFAQRPGYLFQRVLNGGNIARQYHSAGKTVEKTNLYRPGFRGDITGDD